MEKLRVLNIVMAKVWGGGEQYVYDTTLAMKKRGIKVYIAVDESNLIMQKKFSEVAEVIICKLYPLVGLSSLVKLKTFIKNNGITILNIHSGRAMLLAVLLKKTTGIALMVFKHNAVATKSDFYHNWQRKNVDGFICVSKFVYDLQIKGLKEEICKYHLIYNGIVLDKYNIVESKIDEKNCFKIGYAGRITEDKGIEVLLRAFMVLHNKYKNIKLLIAGTSEKNYSKKVNDFIVANGLGDKIRYLGHVEDMCSFYNSIDVFVLPSIVKEAFGLVLCEAMYCGVPVVTTDSGAQKEIVCDNQDGFIVRANNVDDIVKCVENIYLKNIDIPIIIENAKTKVVKNFNVDRCVDAIIELYSDVLMEKKL